MRPQSRSTLVDRKGPVGERRTVIVGPATKKYPKSNTAAGTSDIAAKIDSQEMERGSLRTIRIFQIRGRVSLIPKFGVTGHLVGFFVCRRLAAALALAAVS